jgi:hypothetical protein
MNSALVVTLIRGIIRIGKVSANAYEQYVRDKPALLPLVDMIDPAPDTEIEQAMDNIPAFIDRVQNDSALAGLWPYEDMEDAEKDAAIASLYAALLVVRIEDDNAKAGTDQDPRLPLGDTDAAVGGMFVVQWAKGAGPLGPFSRVILTLADVGLEYVGANPQILGVGGNGEKLIGALARNLASLIPDGTTAGAYGPKARFGERLAAQFLHAGLKAAAENPTLVFDEDHLTQLVEKTLPPIIEALPETLAEQIEWEQVTEALAGPAANAAIKVIAENQVKFLGGKFDPNLAIGALTTAMLKTATEKGLKEQFTKDGMIALYRSLVNVAATRPELFLGRADTDAETIGTAIFTKVMQKLETSPPPFNKDLGAQLAAAMLEALNENKGLFLSASNPWENVTSQVIGQVIAGFQEAFQEQNTDPIESLLSSEQLVEFARIVVKQMAMAPGMIVGNSADESVKKVVAAIAKSMAEDKNLLLTADDWLSIATVAVEEAARSPGRIFGIETTTAEGQLAERVISIALKAAATDLDKARDGVMFGTTLKELINFLLRTATGNAGQLLKNALSDAVLQNPGTSKLEKLFENINATVRAKKIKYGHREWLRLTKVLVLELVSSGVIPLTDEPTLDRILVSGRVS